MLLVVAAGRVKLSALALVTRCVRELVLHSESARFDPRIITVMAAAYASMPFVYRVSDGRHFFGSSEAHVSASECIGLSLIQFPALMS